MTFGMRTGSRSLFHAIDIREGPAIWPVLAGLADFAARDDDRSRHGAACDPVPGRTGKPIALAEFIGSRLPAILRPRQTAVQRHAADGRFVEPLGCSSRLLPAMQFLELPVQDGDGTKGPTPRHRRLDRSGWHLFRAGEHSQPRFPKRSVFADSRPDVLNVGRQLLIGHLRVARLKNISCNGPRMGKRWSQRCTQYPAQV